MVRRASTIILAVVSLAVFALLTATPSLAASDYKVLHFFNGTDGDQPNSGLIFDSAGNLYGVTSGPVAKSSLAFELVPDGNGKWTERVLYRFCSLTKCADGSIPVGPLVIDATGKLYGTTNYGGATDNGVVFELSPRPEGLWTEKVLYNFCSISDCPDGSYPGSLIADSAGNLYGTTYYGGTEHGGTVFELSPGPKDTWTEKVLYSFCTLSNCNDGYLPNSVIFDSAGNLFGNNLAGWSL
jgi:uncharacterized repeat protein (TIGR03803 family)